MYLFIHHFIWFIKQDSQDKNTSFMTFIKKNGKLQQFST